MAALSRRRFLRQAAAAASLPCAALGTESRVAANPGTGGRGAEALESALELLAATGPEYAGGLANHGPMAAEALVALGRPEAVVPWVTRYKKRLDAHPGARRPIASFDWKEALGDGARVGDWIVFFRRRVEERPWRAVLAEWVPRLAPGMIAAAFHGVIRTGHAARSLASVETPARRNEMAEGLAYWAANFTPLPERRAAKHAAAAPSRAVESVPGVPPEKQVGSGNIVDRLAPLRGFAPFAGVADLVDPSGDSEAFLLDLTETFAGVFLASVPPGGLITFLHAVTGPSAVRLLLPHLDAPARADALRYAWQGAAALYSGFGGVPPRASGDGAAPTREDLIDRAIANGDEHAIKFTEACLREHALAGKPVYLRAAHHAITRLG